jgi:uncharacterized membrane protein YphA (DoxX/SURF4 family)
VQRMFSTFPGSWPGIGLLLLRVAVGVTVVAQSAAYFVSWHDLNLATSAVGFMAAASGALLLIGYLTPFASMLAALVCVGSAFTWAHAPSVNLFDSRIAVALATSMLISIICLGPGAFSIDARLFGRREIVIPDAPRPQAP